MANMTEEFILKFYLIFTNFNLNINGSSDTIFDIAMLIVMNNDFLTDWTVSVYKTLSCHIVLGMNNLDFCLTF